MRNFVLLLSAFMFLSTQNLAQNNKYLTPLKTDKLLFYIQRNHNANTIVYDANFYENGNLNSNKPIDVYWRRYDEEGQRMELRNIEKWYAYGVNCEKTDENTVYKIELAADDEKSFWLVQKTAFKAVVRTKINGKNAILDHMYICADTSGAWPSVKYIEFFGRDIITGKDVYEKFIVN